MLVTVQFLGRIILWLEHEKDVTIDILKDEILTALEDDNFNWVGLALETNFVCTSNELPPKPFDVDELLIFTDSFRWKDMVQSDAMLSKEQKDDLKDQFREASVQYYNDIHELMGLEKFEWLPFEVKHSFRSNFGLMEYQNEDIIYCLKIIVWSYLFPDTYNNNTRRKDIGEASIKRLKSSRLDNGWVDMTILVEELKPIYPQIDLFEISQIDWDKDIEHKRHYRNPFTLGFKRLVQTN